MGIIKPETDTRKEWVDAIFQQYTKGTFSRSEYERILGSVLSYPLDEESKKEIKDREIKKSLLKKEG